MKTAALIASLLLLIGVSLLSAEGRQEPGPDLDIEIVYCPV